MTPVYGFSIAAGIDWCITSGREKGVGHHPDPEISGRGTVSPKIFLVVWATVWSKNKGPPLDLPLLTGHQNMS